MRLASIPLSVCWSENGYVKSDKLVCDLKREDELFLFSNKRALTFRRHRLACKVSIMIAEPEVVQKQFYRLIPYFQSRFHRIATHSESILSKCKNAEKWILGGRWVKANSGQNVEKTGMVSIIASKKRSCSGHLLRHELINWARQSGVALDVFGNGYHWLDDKTDGHAPFRFSVVSENTQSAGYFTEKLIDCLICESVPIYCGDPRIGEYFDLRGFVICNNIYDLQQAVSRVDTSIYTKMQPYIVENKRRALALFEMENSMTQLAGPKVFDFS